MAGVVKSMDATLRSMNLEKVKQKIIWSSDGIFSVFFLRPYFFLQISALMDKFEHQFETLDVQTQQMEDTMSSTTTLTTPQVKMVSLLRLTC